MSREEQLKKEIDFLRLYPPAPIWRIEEKEKELRECEKCLNLK